MRKQNNRIAELEAALKAAEMRSEFFSDQLIKESNARRLEVMQLENKIAKILQEMDNDRNC